MYNIAADRLPMGSEQNFVTQPISVMRMQRSISGCIFELLLYLSLFPFANFFFQYFSCSILALRSGSDVLHRLFMNVVVILWITSNVLRNSSLDAEIAEQKCT